VGVTAEQPIITRRTLGDGQRRAIIILLVLAALTGIVFTVRWADTGTSSGSGRLPESVDRLIPVAGGEVPRQSPVGIDVADGFDAYLVINGVEIRNASDGLVRDLGTGLVQFQPAPGLAIETLETDQNCVVAFVWNQLEGQSSGVPVSWCFSAY
jgi:hypothetical protein